jgi:hypothetical protein
VSRDDSPRRRTLTPIGGELQHRELVIGEPSLVDRIRRRIPRRTPTTWYGAFLLGLGRFGLAAAVTVGVAFLIAYLGGWTSDRALPKVFYIIGAFVLLGSALASASPMSTPYESQFERMRDAPPCSSSFRSGSS